MSGERVVTGHFLAREIVGEIFHGIVMSQSANGTILVWGSISNILQDFRFLEELVGRDLVLKCILHHKLSTREQKGCC